MLDESTRVNLWTTELGGWFGERRIAGGSGAQDLVHRLALRQLVDELVQVADLLHERIVDILDACAANRPL